jgi:hypothetical protein
MELWQQMQNSFFSAAGIARAGDKGKSEDD